MAAERRSIDLEGEGRLDEVVREAERAQAPVELRRGGQVVALVVPSEDPAKRHTTPQDLLEFAGSLKGAFSEEFIAELRARRGLPPDEGEAAHPADRGEPNDDSASFEEQNDAFLALAGSMEDIFPEDFKQISRKVRLIPSRTFTVE